MLVSNTHKFVYYHIPKTGGVSVRSLLDQYKTIGPEDYLSKVVHGCDPLHINQAQAKELYDLEGLQEFVIVRNPLSRLISMYGYGKNNDRFGSFSKFIQQVRMHYTNPCLSNFYNSQLSWISERTKILKFEEVIADPAEQFSFLGIKINNFPRENSAEGKYYPTKEEQEYCLDFLSDEYNRLNYTKEI